MWQISPTSQKKILCLINENLLISPQFSQLLLVTFPKQVVIILHTIFIKLKSILTI